MLLESLFDHLMFLGPQKEAIYPARRNSPSAANVKETVDAVRARKPTVNFLLIEMPEKIIIRRAA
jgi:hypothetical protein